MRRWLKVLRLRLRFRSRKAQRRVEAVRGLGDLRPACAVRLLISALGDRESAVRCDAATALGNTGDSRALEALIDALDKLGSSASHGAVPRPEDLAYLSAVASATAVGLRRSTDPRMREPHVLARVNSIFGAALEAAEEQARLLSKARSSFPDSYGGSDRTSPISG